jgi:hypothetical protein
MMKFILQHKPSLKSTPSFSSDVTDAPSASFEVNCVVGVTKEYEFVCPSASGGDKLTISCNGSVSGRLRRHCPTRSSMTLCQSTVHVPSSSSGISTDFDLICLLSPSESNETVTTCLCNLSHLRSMSEDSGSVSFSLMSIEKSVLKEFASTWESAPSLSSREVADSWVVLMTVGGVGVSFLLLILLSIQSDKHESRLVSSIEIQTKHQHGFGENSQSHPSSDDAVGSQERKLIEESLPSIFKSDSLWLKFKEEIKVYHRWLGIVFYYSPEFPRSMRLLSLFSSIVIMLFVQSVTYNIADPDDGSCESCEDESCCLSLQSTVNGKENRCYWQPSGVNSTASRATSGGSCRFREIGEDITRMFIVAIISAVVSAPLALSVQYLIMNVLSKKSVSDEELEKENQRYQLTRMERLKNMRRVDAASSELVESCGKTLLEDLGNLLKELSAHHTALVRRNREEHAQELRGKSHLLSLTDPHLFAVLPRS